jgi:TPR repeat protein
VKKADVTATKPSAAKEQPASALPTTDDKLVADGERYLYGTGVPQSCDRARKNLFTASSNAKAQSLLGAMYATGHCVNRDLPSAYRWFAKALHQEPGNERVARDLEVLWKQMTTAEKQAALRSEQ